MNLFGAGRRFNAFAQTERLWENLAVRLALLVAVPFVMAVVGWLVAGWGAYRSQHHAARMRSILAFLLFGILGLWVTALMFIVANALVR